MAKLSVWDGISLLAIGAAAMATHTVFDRLPDPLPTHFGLDGKPNGWMPRSVGAWFIPVIALALWALVRFVPLALPKSEKRRITTSNVAIAAMLTTLLLAAVHVAVLYVALTPDVDITKVIFVMMAFFFVGLGLLMPRLRRNPIIGVRTPWTLTSDENWARTHRVAGYSMVGGGLLGGIVCLIGGPAAMIGALVCFLGAGIVPAIWSLLYARRQDPS